MEFWHFVNTIFFPSLSQKDQKKSALLYIFYLPVNWFYAIFLQKFIGLAKMLAPKEPSVG